MAQEGDMRDQEIRAALDRHWAASCPDAASTCRAQKGPAAVWSSAAVRERL